MVIILQEEDIQVAYEALQTEALNKKCVLNVEYKVGSLEYVTLCHADSKDDITKTLIADGLVLAEPRREKRLGKLVSEYQKAEEKAKEGRVCVCYLFVHVKLPSRQPCLYFSGFLGHNICKYVDSRSPLS